MDSLPNDRAAFIEALQRHERIADLLKPNIIKEEPENEITIHRDELERLNYLLGLVIQDVEAHDNSFALDRLDEARDMVYRHLP